MSDKIKFMDSLLRNKKEELKRKKKDLNLIEDQIKALEEDIKDVTQEIRNMRKGTLAPVTITEYKNYEPINSIPCNTVEDVKKHFGNLRNKTYKDISADCYFEEDDFSVCFSMELEKLLLPVHKGKVMFIVLDNYSHGENFESPVMDSPTHFEGLQQFQQSVYKTKNKHHIYLERFSKVEKLCTDEVTVFEIRTGS